MAGLRAISSGAGAPSSLGGKWIGLADAMLGHVSKTCVHPSGRWQLAPGDERVDTALLLGAIRGAVSLEDPRSAATFAAVKAELVRDCYAYRFRQDDRPLG